MAYDFYLGTLLLPVPPSKLDIKINNKNTTLMLINDSEINILKKAGLTEISFTALLPNTNYPFAVYKHGYRPASYYLDQLERLKTSQKPFQFIVSRRFPRGGNIFDTNIKVSIEDYKISEDQKNGFDINADINLKQYREYKTKTIGLTTQQGEAIFTVQQSRPADSSKIVIGANVIVNGRLYRDSYGSGPGMSLTNYHGRINFINMSGTHPYHVTSLDGGWLGWMAASCVQAQ